MWDPVIWEALGALFAMIAIVALPVAWYLWRRDRRMRSEGKTEAQINATVEATTVFRSALNRCIPGILFMICGAYLAVMFFNEHEEGWWWGLLIFAAGWFLVPLLARRKWRQYLELKRFAERGPYEYDE